METIALDARLTRQMSVGMKAYVNELVARLPREASQCEFIVFGNEPFAQLPPNARFERVPDSMARNGTVGEQFFLARMLEKSNADLIHFMSVYAPRRTRLPHVYTIHDLIHLRYPRYFSWKVPAYYRLIVRPVAQQARLVITDATATIADLQTYLGVQPSRTRIVPLAAADDFTIDEPTRLAKARQAKERYHLDRPYFIYAGNHRPHKNIKTLVEAWRMTAAASDLVLTEDGPFGFSLDSEAKKNGTIRALGHVSEDELVGLYAGCTAAIQPSLYEGFGIGVLEAMSTGAPTIVSRTPVLMELAGDAALTFGAHDPRELARHLETLLTDATRTETLRRLGFIRSKDFSWRRTARLTAQVYREAIAG